jgi:hypothetical protein
MQFQYFDKLLTRNWFVNDSDIDALLETADDESYNLLWDVRFKYAERIRYALERADWKGSYVPKMKVRDMTENELRKYKQQ